MTIKTDGGFECPFCNLPVYWTADGNGLIHKKPMCERFERLDPDEFMIAVNDFVAARDPEYKAKLEAARAAWAAEDARGTR